MTSNHPDQEGRAEVFTRTRSSSLWEQWPLNTCPGNPDADQHNFSVGFGCRWKKWVVDGFYLADVLETRSVNNRILKGEYDSMAHMVGFSVGYGF